METSEFIKEIYRLNKTTHLNIDTIMNTYLSPAYRFKSLWICSKILGSKKVNDWLNRYL